MQLLDVSQPAILILPLTDFGPGGTVQRAEQPLRPRRGLPPAKENRRVRCQVGDFGTLAFLMGHTFNRDLSRLGLPAPSDSEEIT